MAATYFVLSVANQEGIVQTDKSANKKAFYNFSFKNRLEVSANPAAEINDLDTCLSLPIFSDHFVLQNLTITRKLMFQDSTGITFQYADNGAVPLALPGMRENLHIGFSDAPINVIFPFQDQNMIYIPNSFSANDFQHAYTNRYDLRFLFKKNFNYLNAYLRLSTFNTGDIVLDWAFLQTYMPQGYLLSIIYYQYNILVSGIMDKK